MGMAPLPPRQPPGVYRCPIPCARRTMTRVCRRRPSFKLTRTGERWQGDDIELTGASRSGLALAANVRRRPG